MPTPETNNQDNQDNQDSGLFGPEIHETNMSAGAALQTSIAGLSIGYIGLTRLVKTLPDDQRAGTSDNTELVSMIVEKMTTLLPSIKSLAEWLESVNHAVFDMCIHAPEMDGGIAWNAIELRVHAVETAYGLPGLEAMLDRIKAQLN